MSPEPRPDLPDATRLAVERTRLAHERTLMAWVRTATSLISFGFTIYKFFEYVRESGRPHPESLLGPREFAILMIVIGLLALVVATFEHRREVARLRRRYAGEVPYSLATWLATLVAGLGILGLLAVIFRQ
jgi:putative membrane protein